MTSATSQVVADTHVLVWYLTDSARLSSAAQQALEACVADDHPIVVNSISLVELVYAAEKAKNPVTVDQRDYTFEVLDRDDSPFIVVPTTPAIARAGRYRPPGPLGSRRQDHCRDGHRHEPHCGQFGRPAPESWRAGTSQRHLVTIVSRGLMVRWE